MPLGLDNAANGHVKGGFPADVRTYRRDMNSDETMRFAAGETEQGPPPPPAADETPENTGIPESDAIRKDMSYSPASETETEQKQDDPLPDTIDDDIDPDQINAVPGTGGPDDVGDVEVDPDDLNLPFRS